ncbi:MAG TPA: tetratricopeptide repeat protein [bacterium]|nr:tetratricopeptide repeat protein [bacterium]
MRWKALLFGGLAALLLASCGGGDEPPADETLDLTAPPDGGAVAPVEVPTAERYAEVAEGPLNLREEPTVDSAVIVQLPVRARVEILSEGRQETVGEDTDRWYEVRTADGKHGYVFGAFLTLDAPAPAQGTPAPPTTLELPGSATPIPGDLGPVELLGLSEEAETTGRLFEAADYLAAALSANPENVKGYFHLSDLYFELERYADAATALENYIAGEPDSFWGHNNLGLAYIRVKNYPRAIAVLERAVQLEPEGRSGEAGKEAVRLAYRNLIAAYQANRDTEGAERARRRMDAL